MKKICLFMAIVFTSSLFFGCSTKTNVNSYEDNNSNLVHNENENNDIVSDKEILSKYVDVSNLPIFDLDINNKSQFDDRTISIEDSIDNELEYTVYQLYYNETLGDYKKVMELIGEDEGFKIAMQNGEKNFEDGIYMKEYVIHELSVLDKNDIKEISNYSKIEIKDKIDKLNLEQYAIVMADLSFKHNEKSLSLSPQLGDGRYIRYYILGKTSESDNFKIYNVYWDNL